MGLIVDTNVLLDVLTDDPNWADWSEKALIDNKSQELLINPAIFAELSFGFSSVSEVESVVSQFGLVYTETPKDGLFRASKAFAAYKKRGGTKSFVLPDFFIGGHAESSCVSILTRDTQRYSTYFPSVTLISP